MGLATHSIQSRVHSSQGHQGSRLCFQVEFHSVPRTIRLGTVHVQLQLAEVAGGGQSGWGELVQSCVLCPLSWAGDLAQTTVIAFVTCPLGYLVPALGNVPPKSLLRSSASTSNFFSIRLTGPRTVIHPKARIIAEAGPIVIGEGNLIEEQALIINA